jgi:acyl-CoA synthetase (AMP-forming)/AMP-acid ligase II
MSAIHTAIASPEVLGFHLLRHAAEHGDERAFTFLKDGDSEDAHLTWGMLAGRAVQVAEELAALGLSGQRAVLFHPPGLEFVVAFCGCLLAGVVAVPLHPPVTRRLQERAQAVIDDCRSAAVLTTAAGMAGIEPLVRSRSLALVATDALRGAGTARQVQVAPERPAFLQYTSGSTGSPKGVVITHGNLVENSRLIGRAFGTRPGEVGVNWLPLLHDMGLIGSVVHVIHQRLHCVHLSPQSMIRKPRRWLEAVSHYRAVISGGPDFAWRLLADRLTPADLAGLDLSSWRVAYSGAEPVRATTLDRVSALLAPTGFRGESFLPCYGLAEATLFVSGGGELRLETPATGEAEAVHYVGCGAPLPAGSVAIVDPDTHAERPVGTVGEVWVTGAHVAAGYWGREQASEATFRARRPGDERSWLRTGDLGFLKEGQLFISGRIKDLLIVNGRKHHPEDVETTVQGHVEECAGGAAAAFQAEVDGRARLVVAVEMADRPTDAAELAGLRDRINAAVWCFHEILVDEVVAVRPGRLPRTTSGKVRRGEVRVQWMAGELGMRGEGQQ